MKGEGMFDERDVLLKAAERISEEGMWCRGFWHQPLGLDVSDALNLEAANGPLLSAVEVNKRGLRVAECVEGAIASAAVGLAGDLPAARLLFHGALGLFEDHVGRTAIGYNDEQAKSASEVATAMRTAAL